MQVKTTEQPCWGTLLPLTRIEAVSRWRLPGIPATAAAKGQSQTYAYELTCYYTLYPGENRLDRSAQLLRKSAGKADHQKMDAFVFAVPGVALGDPAECTITVPGPFWPKNLVIPGTPYTQLTKGRIGFHSAPDAGFGLITLGNEKQQVSLGSFMSTGGEVAYHSSLYGDGQRITFQHNDLRAYYLPERVTVYSDTQRVVVEKAGLPAVLKQYRKMVTETLPIERHTPAWVKDMILLEVYPKYYPDGFKGNYPEITRLPGNRF